ncbi:MAG: helix-turn-helix transcriptional regulator, partial [Candidatus Puniceispirillum sp.]
MPNRNIFQNDEEDSTLGGRISQAREASGMSVAEVVKQLGVRANTYEAWESDRSEPRANKLVALAGILNV